MILNGSAHVFLNLNENNKQSLKDLSRYTQKKLNVIKLLQHFILCNMKCYGALKAAVNIAFQCSIAHHIAHNEVQ